MFKSNLRALKLGRGVSWAEISRQTGISEASLCRIAANKRWTTNTRHLEALCRYFGCRLDQLLEFDPRIGQSPSCHIDDLYPTGRRPRTTITPTPTPNGSRTNGRAGGPSGRPARARRQRP